MREIKTSVRHNRKNVKLIEALLASPVAADLLGSNPSARQVRKVHKQLIDNRKFFVRIDSGPMNYI